MRSLYEILAAKRDGEQLPAVEIKHLVDGYTADEIKDYQFSAFLMAAFINGLDDSETSALTKSMLESGKTVRIKGLDRPLIDKHSTGGVGDKLSIVIAPLLATCGIAVGMFSGRGLGHTGGTLDKLESIPGMRVFHTSREFARLLKKHHFAVSGQTAHIAPADRKIYALRDATGTVESIPLIVASIMSKKLALKSDGIVFDVKTGSGAFMKRTTLATRLAKSLLQVAESHNLRARAVITNMNQPTGRMIGNFLEMMESVAVLQGGGPTDTTNLAVEIAAQMLIVSGVEKSLSRGKKRVRAKLNSGDGYEVLCRYLKDCGGNTRTLEQPQKRMARVHKQVVKAKRSGFVSAIDTARLGHLVASLGAGRTTTDDRIDPLAGMEMLVKIGDKVVKGDSLAILYAGKSNRLAGVTDKLAEVFHLSGVKPKSERLILKRLSNG